MSLLRPSSLLLVFLFQSLPYCEAKPARQSVEEDVGHRRYKRALFGFGHMGSGGGRDNSGGLNGLYRATGIMDVISSGLRLGTEATNLGGSILSYGMPQGQFGALPQAQFGAPQQFGAQAQYSSDMELQTLQDTQPQACSTEFSYYASNGSPVYLCDCPNGISYQYLRCVNPVD
ncbi:unnamed protein product [Cylicocyclus nassatus]|uniref:Uncharacterized protein n=1 Tax=Cylicocyclus nassatus TaxID=53992 RepID=A0AA36M7W7_CYLNA|nr:unnamed protein product [Cylicocyclus nassatus]